VASTAEIEALKTLGTERMRGGVRLYFVAGARVRRRLASHEERLAALRSSLGAPDDGLLAALDARLAKAAESAKRASDLESSLAALLAESQATRREAVALLRVDSSLVIPVAQAYSRMAASPLLLVVATESSGPFCLVAGTGGQADAQVAGATAAEILGGRGGGSGALYRGKGEALGRADEAAAAVEALHGGPASRMPATAGEAVAR
jgi:alanyl-tRNA synthetase